MIADFIDGLSVYLQGTSLLALPAAYLGGVLVSFTPCVYPIAPITMAYIGVHGRGARGKGFFLSLLYTLGMALTYTALGAAAALSGKLFGLIQSSPWMYFVIANICILMGLSMLEVFQLPLGALQFVYRLQPRKEKKGYLGSFLVGAASGLIIGPCTAPALAVLLSYVAARQNMVLGMGLLFAFALGMGTLLIILGTFASLLTGLPRSGQWMSRISHLGGWLLLATGEYFLIQAGMLWS